MRFLLCLLMLLIATPLAAETCKYVDNEGRVTYSNVPVKNAKKVSCFDAPAAPAPSAAPAAPAPRVTGPTQRKRDDERRRILEEELVSAQAALDEARKALAEQESIREGGEKNYQRVLDRLKPFQEAVAEHEKNVASLKQELANLR
jgi:hypothetical protein